MKLVQPDIRIDKANEDQRLPGTFDCHDCRPSCIILRRQ